LLQTFYNSRPNAQRQLALDWLRARKSKAVVDWRFTKEFTAPAGRLDAASNDTVTQLLHPPPQLDAQHGGVNTPTRGFEMFRYVICTLTSVDPERWER
jgi:hypothetical protein